MRKFLAIVGTLLLVVFSAVILIPKSDAFAVTVFRDFFSGATTILTSHTPDTGTSWTQVIDNGGVDLEVNGSGILDSGGCGLNEGAAYTADATYPQADYSVSVSMTVGDSSDDYNWLGIRVEADGDGYWLRFNEEGAQFYEASGGAGTFTTLGSSYGSAIATSSIIKIEMIGTALKAYDDGVEILSTSDATYSAAGKGGIGMGDVSGNGNDDCSGQALDNFLVQYDDTSISGEGPNYPDTGENENSVGTVAWSNPGNVVSDNGSFATASLSAANTTSQYLKATDFDFSIPTGATINGIVLEIDRAGHIQSDDENDNAVRLVKGGVISGDNKQTDTQWASAGEIVSYGSSSDLWGLTWTTSEINATDFGAAVSAIRPSGSPFQSAVVSVDFMRITVFYTPAAGGAVYSQTRTQVIWFQ